MLNAVSDKSMAVGVFGAYGFGNMGDAMVADATIAGIKRYLPNAKFVAICQQPDNARIRHGIDALPIFRDYIRNVETKDKQKNAVAANHESSHVEHQPSLISRVVRLVKSIPPLFKAAKLAVAIIQTIIKCIKETAFSIKVFRQLRKFDILVMSGSGQMNEEWGGPWRLPFALFRWSLLARLAGCRVAFMSVGGGAFKHPLTRFFCKWAVQLAHYKSIRDQHTFDLLKSWGVTDLKLVPDMAFSVELPSQPARAENEALAVCINPISYCDPRSWHVADIQRYNAYIAKLAEFGDSLLSAGYEVHFVPNNLDMDNPTIDDILSKMHVEKSLHHLIKRPETLTYLDVFANIGKCDLVVASRFHGVVFSLMQNKPVIGLAHHYKYVEVLKEMGQEKYCLDIKTFEFDELQQLFDDLRINRKAATETIASFSSTYKNITEQQFVTVAKLAASESIPKCP